MHPGTSFVAIIPPISPGSSQVKLIDLIPEESKSKHSCNRVDIQSVNNISYCYGFTDPVYMAGYLEHIIVEGRPSVKNLVIQNSSENSNLCLAITLFYDKAPTS